ncbi:hypothetical protein ACHAWF_014500 [Thalassiosira exigua]
MHAYKRVHSQISQTPSASNPNRSSSAPPPHHHVHDPCLRPVRGYSGGGLERSYHGHGGGAGGVAEAMGGGGGGGHFDRAMNVFGSFHLPKNRGQAHTQPSSSSAAAAAASGGGARIDPFRQGWAQRPRSRQNSSQGQLQKMQQAQQQPHQQHRQQQRRQSQPQQASSRRFERSNATSATYVPPTVQNQGSAEKSAQSHAHVKMCDSIATASSNVSASSSRSNRSHGSSKPSSSSSSKDAASDASAWRTTLDPTTNKTYYWNVKTRESRWKKPLELASEEEREAIKRREREQRDFFAGMERNILRQLEDGKRRREEKEARKAAEKMQTDEKFSSPGNVSMDEDKRCGGIDQSWIVSGPSSSGHGAGADADWIQGWITPGSSDGSALNGLSSPAGSLTSMDLSVATPGSMGSLGCSMSGSMEGSMGGSMGSLGSVGREERDDKLFPLKKPSKIERLKSGGPLVDKCNLIRTISRMEMEMAAQLNPALAQMRAQKTDSGPKTTDDIDDSASKRLRTHGAPNNAVPLTPVSQTCDILSSLHLTLCSEGLDVALLGNAPAVPVMPVSPMTPEEDDVLPPERSLSCPDSAGSNHSATSSALATPREDVVKPGLAKRNTCGTIYLASTLSAPDKDALIRCVCGVYRAHLLQAAGDASPPTDTSREEEKLRRAFDDRRAPGDYRPLDVTSVPTLSEVTDFYRSVFLRSQMEADCIIISLVYVERLVKRTRGGIGPRRRNWRSVLFSCMVLASKVWDDLSMWNGDFSRIGPSGVTFSLARTNELEVALLNALGYWVKVNASEYAKYYFLLRGMLCRSGLASDDLRRLEPLDAEGARTLGGEEEKKKKAPRYTKQRSKSYGHAEVTESGSGESSVASGSTASKPIVPQSSPTSKRVSLEQIVRM